MRRCGNAASGILEFPVLGGLTVGESEIINKMQGQDTVFIESARCAQQIARAEKISTVEAFDIVQKALTGEAIEGKSSEAAERNAEAIDRLRKLCMEQGNRSKNALVTALIRCRLGLPDWDDLNNLPVALYEDIYKLGEDEQAAEEPEVANAPTEEALGKQPKVSRNGKRLTTPASVGS